MLLLNQQAALKYPPGVSESNLSALWSGNMQTYRSSHNLEQL